jgi:hypothetical protein
MLEQIKEILSKRFGIELIVTLDSREENCRDERYGHFLQCDFNIGYASNSLREYPPTIVIYENETVQLYRDSVPYPVKTNTAREARLMLTELAPSSVNYALITAEDFNVFITAMIEIGEAEDN